MYFLQNIINVNQNKHSSECELCVSPSQSNGLLIWDSIVQFHFGNFQDYAKLSVTAYPSLSKDHHKLISQNMKWKCMLQSKHLKNPKSHSKSGSQFDLLCIEITDLSENENVYQKIVSQSILRMLTFTYEI